MHNTDSHQVLGTVSEIYTNTNGSDLRLLCKACDTTGSVPRCQPAQLFVGQYPVHLQCSTQSSQLDDRQVHAVQLLGQYPVHLQCSTQSSQLDDRQVHAVQLLGQYPVHLQCSPQSSQLGDRQVHANQLLHLIHLLSSSSKHQFYEQRDQA